MVIMWCVCILHEFKMINWVDFYDDLWWRIEFMVYDDLIVDEMSYVKSIDWKLRINCCYLISILFGMLKCEDNY
jgi:hypothetical protein